MTSPNQQNTGTELALSPRQERLVAVRDELAPGAKPQAIIPRNFVEAQQLCQALATSSLVPKAYRSATGAVDMLLVVMTGSELGIPPMAALRLFTTWDGVPRLMAEGIRAVMMMSPDIEIFEMATCSDQHATWIGKRRGRPEKSVTWTMERAKRAGLLNKDPWIKYQEAMLNARASMDLGRILAPDIIAGMRSLEEAQDGDFVDAHSIERKPEFVAPAGGTFVSPNAHAIPPAGSAGSVTLSEGPPKFKVGKAAKDKPIEAKATEVPTSAEEPKISPASSGSTSTAGGASASTAAGASPLSQAIDQARAADAARATPTPPSTPTEPSPSTGSAPPSTVESGASSGPAADAPDDSFGEDPPDAAPAPSGNRLADFFAELAKCVNQRELAEVADKWRVWSRQQAEGGDKTFSKNGENAAKMSKMYATRKAEVPA